MSEIVQKTVGIVGLGLIGGSLGLELRRLGYRVLGVSRRPVTCERAIALGVADQAEIELATVSEADVIFICTPLNWIETSIRQLLPDLKPTTVVTDVGSVKNPIVEAIAPLWENFVGGHPMAGTAEQGIEAAQWGLFKDAPYVLTPLPSTPTVAVEQVKEIVQALGSRLYCCEPQQHDRAVAWISHLPLWVSASLIEACLQEEEQAVLQLAQSLASSGFRDTSRVGGGNPELGEMIARYNGRELLRSLYTYRRVLDQVIAQVEEQDWEHLLHLLGRTESARPAFVKHPPSPG
ncbi:prephenate/arogenate dehydrogenase [Spirulina subsalsa FACHB-351]|uniref:Prephenate/arogenate dehydrogenase n=1 Tax=Spirulina subsalsa FACHB-351 TaxID=234711 RepID=A0ABT3L7V3_9CYAN|nr:prephenate/arogenate dehydrogenase [Spirulina subsalsa]MCW6037257.1 prephenate/arogenate dehydrogenase [Spirulina subsalsa FACHB-351]